MNTTSIDFSGKVALVTGAGSGIGRAAAIGFARAGADVALAGRRRAELEAVAHEIEALGRRALVKPTDVSDAEAAETLVAATVDRLGRLDAAFNNAGIEGALAPVAELTPAQFDETVAVNLKGAWLSCKYELTAMRRLGQGGAIVNTSSWLAHGAFPETSIYSASKAGLDGMTRALALEAAEHGVRVNNVNPGIIDTPMLRRLTDEAATALFVGHTPQRRLGRPEDVADVVLWLCCDGARFVTGQNVLVDGGYAIPGHRVGREAA